jgi:hypothetical protein
VVRGAEFKEFKEFRSSGVQEFRSSGVQEFRSSGVQEFRSSGWGATPDCKQKPLAQNVALIEGRGDCGPPELLQLLELLNSSFSISPETDGVAFLVHALETTSRCIDDQVQVFRFAFERVKSEGLVFHVHLGGR